VKMNAWLRFWAKCCACCLPKGLTKTNPPQATESDPLLVSLAPESPVRSQQGGQGVGGAPGAPHKSTPLPRARRFGAINDIPKVSLSTSFSESSLSRVSTPPASDSPLVLDPKTPINGDVSDRVQFSITSSPQAVARAPLKSIPFGISLAIDSPIHSHSNSSSSSSASSSSPISSTTGAGASIQTVSPSSPTVSVGGPVLIPTPSSPVSQSSSTSSSSSVQSIEVPVVVVSTVPDSPPPETLSAINTPSSAIISSTTTSSSASPTATLSSLSATLSSSQLQAEIPIASSISSNSGSAGLQTEPLISSASIPVTTCFAFTSASTSLSGNVNSVPSTNVSSSSLFSIPARRHNSSPPSEQSAPAPSHPKSTTTLSGQPRPVSLKNALKSTFDRITAPDYVISQGQLSVANCLIEMYNRCELFVADDTPQSTKGQQASEYKMIIRKLMMQFCAEKTDTGQGFGVLDLLHSDDFRKLKEQFATVQVPVISGQVAINGGFPWSLFGDGVIASDNTLLSMLENRNKMTDKIRFIICCGYCLNDNELCKKYRTLAENCKIELNTKKPAAPVISAVAAFRPPTAPR